MRGIHERCERYGRVDKDYIDYVKGANIAGFVKVADAMIAYGVT
jgi:glutamate dehydrogenase (NADP+)